MGFICKRCNQEYLNAENELICGSCKNDLDLLDKQLNVNAQRIKKLEEHKKSIEPELKNPKSEKDNERLLETMKRINSNLQFEYEQREGIIKAIKSKNIF